MSAAKTDKDKGIDNSLEETFTGGEFPRNRASTDDDAAARSVTLQIDDPEHKNTPNCFEWLKPSKSLKRFILTLICMVVATSFTTPIIIYGVDSDRRSNAENYGTILIDLDPENCIEAQEINDDISMLSLYNDQCLNYNGICTEYLSQLSNGSLLFTLIHQGVSEDTIEQFIRDYIPLASQQCRDNILPFLCQYFFPPCDITNNDAANLISRKKCSNIRDNVCSFEWNAVKNTPLAHNLLPNCESFDDNDDDNDTLVFEPHSLQCHYQFKEFCGLCLPLCGKFMQLRDDTEFKVNTVVIFAVTAAFIGGLLVFIVSVYRWKIMLDFPSVHVVYNTACAFVIASFTLISYIGGHETLFCTHEVLNVAYVNPSTYCQITGFVFHWALVLMVAYWLLHLIHLFLKIVFPLWSRKLDVKQTKITLHVTEAVGAVVLCGLAPIAHISMLSYSSGRFPTLLCTLSKEFGFYTVCIPMCVMVATGVILTIIMFWILHKRQQLLVKRDSKCCRHCISFSVPEVKALILSCFFIIFGITTLIKLSIDIRDSNIRVDRLLAYFACQAKGNTANNTCTEEYDNLQVTFMTDLDSAAYFLMGLIPWLNLLFAIQVRHVKKGIQKVVGCYAITDSHHDSNTVSSIAASK